MLKSLLLFIALVPSVAFAGFEFSPSLSMFKADKGQSATQVELRVGYSFEDTNLYLGGFYSLASDKIIEHVDQYFFGPMIGYQYNGAYVLAAYILTGEQDLASGGVKYSSAKGYQASIGYRMELTTDVFLGPEFTWRQVDFDNREVQGIAGKSERQDTHVLPSITFQFKF
jgi:hypothetical protein